VKDLGGYKKVERGYKKRHMRQKVGTGKRETIPIVKGYEKKEKSLKEESLVRQLSERTAGRVSKE